MTADTMVSLADLADPKSRLSEVLAHTDEVLASLKAAADLVATVRPRMMEMLKDGPVPAGKIDAELMEEVDDALDEILHEIL